MCPDGVQVGEECTWRSVERVKTITADCMLSLGYGKACKEDKGFPMQHSTDLLTQALAQCPSPI